MHTVRTCYPCNAAIGLYHYNGTDFQQVHSLAFHVNAVRMGYCCSCAQQIPVGSAVACPGGQANPMICVPPKMHSSDYGACICTPGLYLASDNSCQDCTNGYFCPDGINRVPCPLHYYQDGSGSKTACTKCTLTGDQYGSPIQTCPAGQQAAWCDRTSTQSNSQSQPIANNCVDCTCCNTDYYTSQRAGCRTNCYI